MLHEKKREHLSLFLIGTNSKRMIFYVNGSGRMYTDGYELYIANIIYCSMSGISFSAALLLFDQFSTLSWKRPTFGSFKSWFIDYYWSSWPCNSCPLVYNPSPSIQAANPYHSCCIVIKLICTCWIIIILNSSTAYNLTLCCFVIPEFAYSKYRKLAYTLFHSFISIQTESKCTLTGVFTHCFKSAVNLVVGWLYTCILYRVAADLSEWFQTS